MNRILPAVLALPALLLWPLAVPGAADEFTDVLDGARSAYAEGDIDGALKELDYATKLLTEIKSQSLSKFLPEPLAGWTRKDADAEGAGVAMAMLGGGTSAAASYSNGTSEMTVTLMANSPMISGMAAMIAGMSSLGGGKPVRIQRTEFGVNEGEMQGVVDGRVLVSVSGNAPVEAKTALIEQMDFKALADF